MVKRVEVQSLIHSIGEVIETIILQVVPFCYSVLLDIKMRLSITVSKQDLQVYLKWKTDPIIYFYAKKVQKESGLTVTSVNGSILSLINVKNHQRFDGFLLLSTQPVLI